MKGSEYRIALRHIENCEIASRVCLREYRRQLELSGGWVTTEVQTAKAAYDAAEAAVSYALSVTAEKRPAEDEEVGA